MNRRQILSLAAATPLMTAGTALIWPRYGLADPLEPSEGDRILGDPDAPVTIIEYSSLTCPHCARFHTQTMPQVKKEWVETGKARVIARHYPLDRLALFAALVAECVESNDRYFAFLHMLYKDQNRWARSNDPVSEISQRAKLVGLGQEDIERCISDESARRRIIEKMTEGRDSLGVNSTPTVLVEGEKVGDGASYDAVNEALKDAYEG